ncbi:MAG TPA: sialidase family protein [Actinomycetota bacterium]
MRLMRSAAILGLLALVAALVPAFSASASGGDVLVTNGSPMGPFSQNKQNETPVVIDPAHPSVVVSGANEEIDMEACNAGPPNDCPFTPGVGVSGVYFSFNRGGSWFQPTYTGWTARFCLGDPDSSVTTDTCQPEVGPIGTIPKYFENGLVADGDPAVTFGPQPDSNGHFSWANGSRLYYANLTSNFSSQRSEQGFKGFEAIAVSRLDGDPAITPSIASNGDNWMDPVIASKQNAALFSDKEQVWADQAQQTSSFFGNVYVCYGAFRGPPGHAQSLIVIRSTDGGDTWTQQQVTPASNNGQHFGRSGCTIRTDSEGTVYVFYEEFGQFATEGQVGSINMVKSFDGGVTWTDPQVVTSIVEPGVFDPVLGRPTMDGIAGFRVDLAGSPSADIANGAPTGNDATDDIVLSWADARDGLNNEHAMFIDSTDHGNSWSNPVAVETGPSDRPAYVASSISPNGTDVYLDYDAVLTPYSDNTTDVRQVQGVVLHADFSSGTGATNWTELHRAMVGDPRGSSQNGLTAEFFGDYLYTAAARHYGVAVWMDVRDAGVCDAINEYRGSLYTDSPESKPPVQDVCPLTFGNSDIYSGSFADPTP